MVGVNFYLICLGEFVVGTNILFICASCFNFFLGKCSYLVGDERLYFKKFHNLLLLANNIVN